MSRMSRMSPTSRTLSMSNPATPPVLWLSSFPRAARPFAIVSRPGASGPGSDAGQASTTRPSTASVGAGGTGSQPGGRLPS